MYKDDLKSIEYNEYLNSDTWKATSVDYCCEICDKTIYVGFDIHHKTTPRIR